MALIENVRLRSAFVLVSLAAGSTALLGCGTGETEPPSVTTSGGQSPGGAGQSSGGAAGESSGGAGTSGAGASTAGSSGTGPAGMSGGNADTGGAGAQPAPPARVDAGVVATEAGAADGPRAADARSPVDVTVVRGDGGDAPTAQAKARVVVMTDIANEPDDQESLVRYLVYSNEFDTEALIASTSTFLRTAPREDIVRTLVAAYGMVRPNLLKHAPGFPDAAALLAVTGSGQPTYGIAAAGAGKSSVGSRLIIAAVDKPDPRPVWVTGWGGTNTLAQALQDVRASRTPAEVARFVEKVRFYAISNQDDAGKWIRTEFPDLFYIVSPSNQGSSDFVRATWTGIRRPLVQERSELAVRTRGQPVATGECDRQPRAATPT